MDKSTSKRIATTASAGYMELLRVVAGVVGGLVTTALFATVLRFDLRPVPALAATYLTLQYVVDAIAKGTPSAVGLASVSIITTLVLTWATTHYLQRQ